MDAQIARKRKDADALSSLSPIAAASVSVSVSDAQTNGNGDAHTTTTTTEEEKERMAKAKEREQLLFSRIPLHGLDQGRAVILGLLDEIVGLKYANKQVKTLSKQLEQANKDKKELEGKLTSTQVEWETYSEAQQRESEVRLESAKQQMEAKLEQVRQETLAMASRSSVLLGKEQVCFS